jgi:serine/threonine protein phosphatase PrpC
LHDGKGNDVLIAAVFDGHGGTAASHTASELFPEIFSSQISASVIEGGEILGNIMESTWEQICNTYRNGCDKKTSCVADYDSVNGVVLASTSSSDLVAGTTAVAAALLTNGNMERDYVLQIMNCGDSRSVLAGRPRDRSATGASFVHFSTKDHSPRCEMETARLMKGVQAGLDYSLPQCSLSRWWLTVGDYQYAVSRSLEGVYATSKGIVSTPDMSQIELRQVLAERENVTLVLASDGLYEVIDNEELSRDLVLLREAGYSAKDAAKSIVGQALKKGTSDNISLVVIYFE